MLGKSPVTLRGWEDKGLVDIPREQSVNGLPPGDRKLECSDVRTIADRACELGRINHHRVNLVHATMTIMEQIEKENNRNWKEKQ
jgi:hypothetical protein